MIRNNSRRVCIIGFALTVQNLHGGQQAAVGSPEVESFPRPQAQATADTAQDEQRTETQAGATAALQQCVASYYCI